MAKWINDSALDAALTYVCGTNGGNGRSLVACSAQPTTYTEAYVTYALADVALTPGDGEGDFTIGNGDSSGRKLTTAQQSNVTVDASGTATHVAIVDTTGSALLAVTTCTSFALTSGSTVTFPAFDFEIADPV